MSDSLNASVVEYSRSSAGNALVTLNRPDVRNAINRQLRVELVAAFRRADDDEDVRSITIRGAGDVAFCAGADVKEFVPPESVVQARADRRPPSWNDVIAATRKPTIASVHGYCLGGGLEIALACDVRIAADDAVFGLPEVLLGIIPGAGGTQRLPRLVGVAHALRLILTGDRVGAAEALEMGLVTAVVPRGDLEQASAEWATKLSRGAPRAIEYAKEAITRGMEMELVDGLRLEADLATLLMTSEDRVEGMASFRERRSPRFTGR